MISLAAYKDETSSYDCESNNFHDDFDNDNFLFFLNIENAFFHDEFTRS